MEEAAALAHRLSDDITLSIDHVSRDLDRISAVEAELLACGSTLKTLIALSSRPFLDAAEEMSNDVLDDLYKQYTMREEREIHQALSGRSNVSISQEEEREPVERPAVALEDEDELGDFELF